jgi:hypothetical protein
MNTARIESMLVTVCCPCGHGDIRITLVSLLYNDAICPQCRKRWTATVTIAESTEESINA